MLASASGPRKHSSPGIRLPPGTRRAGRYPAWLSAVNTLRDAQRHGHEGQFALPQLAGDLRGSGAAVQPDVLPVPQQARHARGDPDLGVLPFQLPLPVAGIFAPEHQAPGSAVDPAEDAIGGQGIQVAPDGGTGSSALRHQLVNGHLFTAPQQFTDQPVPLFSPHASNANGR